MVRGRWVTGMVSGGCLESELIGNAWDLTANGPAIHVFDASSEGDALWGYGLGCAGVVHVLLERVSSDDPTLDLILKSVNSGVGCLVQTVVSEGPRLGLRAVRVASDSAGDAELLLKSSDMARGSSGIVDEFFIEHLEAPLKLAIFGAGHDAIPLAAVACQLGWRVVVVDPREEYLSEQRFPGVDKLVRAHGKEGLGKVAMDCRTYVVLMTHNYLQDQALLEALLPSEAPYIGLLGPRARKEKLLGDLGIKGSPEKLHGPVGLDIGAEGPEEIALAIAAEIQQVHALRMKEISR